jgi:hypothetical protein
MKDHVRICIVESNELRYKLSAKESEDGIAT